MLTNESAYKEVNIKINIMKLFRHKKEGSIGYRIPGQRMRI